MEVIRVTVMVDDAYGHHREATVRVSPWEWRAPGGAPDPETALLIALERGCEHLRAWMPVLPVARTGEPEPELRAPATMPGRVERVEEEGR